MISAEKIPASESHTKETKKKKGGGLGNQED